MRSLGLACVDFHRRAATVPLSADEIGGEGQGEEAIRESNGNYYVHLPIQWGTGCSGMRLRQSLAKTPKNPHSARLQNFLKMLWRIGCLNTMKILVVIFRRPLRDGNHFCPFPATPWLATFQLSLRDEAPHPIQRFNDSR